MSAAAETAVRAWTPLTYSAAALEIALVLAGAILLWRLVLSAGARAQQRVAPLPPWNARPTDFLVFLMHALLGGFGGSILASLLARAMGLTGDKLMIAGTAGLHGGILTGIVAFHLLNREILEARFGSFGRVLLSGTATFLIAMPLIVVVGFAWVGLLTLVGIPVERQPAVELFLRLKSPGWLIFMTVTAGLIAPITEELAFRLGLFRYLRTRLPRWAALALPAIIFAASHADLNTFAQLAVLGILFSCAYERTGLIGTTMVAHAFFNLNSVLLLMAGLPV